MRALLNILLAHWKAKLNLTFPACNFLVRFTSGLAAMSLTEDAVRQMKAAELRTELRQRGLDPAGAKSVLCQRLLDALPQPDPTRERESRDASSGSSRQGMNEANLRDIIREEIRAAMTPSTSFTPSLNQLPATATLEPPVTGEQPQHPASSSVSSSQLQAPTPGPSAATELSMRAPSGKRLFYATIPKSVIDKVVTGQFVEFSSLLPPRSLCLESSEMLRVDRDSLSGNLVIAQGNKSTRRVDDMDAWLEAWTVFAAIFCSAHPSRAHELCAYQHAMLKASQKFKFSAVADYDRSFRAMMAADATRRWDEVVQDLYTTVFDVRASRPFRGNETGKPAPVAELCRLFNRGKCARTSCRYSHSCSACGSRSHGFSACTQTGQPHRSN